MSKSFRLRPILASALLLVCTREAVGDVSVADYGTFFNDHVEITFPNAPGKNNPLKEFPLLVKLAKDSPAGFSYERVDPLGEDIRFVFVDGTTSNAVPYDVDCWNTNGVSTLWVKLTKYSNASGLKLVMYWAPDDPDALPANAPRTVWSDYAAVWHMNGSDDSAPHAIGSTCGSKVSVRDGKIGSALGMSSVSEKEPILQVPPGTAVDAITNGAYTISGWLRATVSGGFTPWLYTARTNDSDSAYGASLSSDTDGTHLTLWRDSSKSSKKISLSTDQWTHFAVTHRNADGYHRLYLNGVQKFEGATWTDASSAHGFSLGGLAGVEASLFGDLDEVRICPVEQEPSWITNEYAQAASSDRIAFGTVVSTGKSVYVRDPSEGKEPGDDPTPSSPENVSPADYAGTAVFTPTMTEGVAKTNYVLVISVKKGDPEGFDPKALPFEKEDIRFFDQDGNVLDYTNETWNVEATSVFKVVVPILRGSSQITMCWGLRAGCVLPENDPSAVTSAAGTWSAYTSEPASWDDEATLQNRWKTEPACGKTEWDVGETPSEFTNGVPWYGTSTVSYKNRSTGATQSAVPTEAGDYSAVFSVEAVDSYSALTYTINFRIRQHRPVHDGGEDNDRILILNDDTSVSGGKVLSQSYNDTGSGLDAPYWVHDVDSGYDYTSTSPYYNFCGGLRHTYYARDGRRLWDLIDVRYGNTYNNADWVFEQTGDWEEGDEGLSETMNYLKWNPKGGRLVDDLGDSAGDWHEYAAQAVMCNSTMASINSCLYTNGIGTIYFDCVNSHTDDATNGYYRLVVEIATNVTGSAELPTDEAIECVEENHDEWIESEQRYARRVYDSYGNADWHRLTMNVRLVKDGALATNLWTTDELTLCVTNGRSYGNCYRVYVPFDCLVPVRFRIRRTAVNPDYTTSGDVHSMILVDNVICSKPTDRVNVEPRGFYDAKKEHRETVGYEGAFNPSYPSVSDSDLYARVRATTLSGEAPAAGRVTSVLMHYRWRYLNQQATDWLTADVDPGALTTFSPVPWPRLSGDLEYWYEVGQANDFYSYADYSGLGIGLDGYSEEIACVTNRASTYGTSGQDWFTRIRDGKSTYGAIRLHVKRGKSAAADAPIDMFVARDRVWRGCVHATNAITGGLYFRFEARDRQDETLADFQFNTNFWYMKDTVSSLPASASAVVGTSENWGCVPCDGASGYLMFQLDESTRALTVVHADWQDFDGWDDAHHEYFSGTSTEDASKSGVSGGQCKYECGCSQWDDDVATNSFWIERFIPSGGYAGYSFYSQFLSEESPNGFGVGEGMWVRGAYADTSDLSGMALQMAGQGRGHIQLVRDADEMPRGIEAVKFNARISQPVDPGKFARYESYTKNDTNYTFLTRVAFDQNGNSNFTGNATLSLAAFYRPDTSCYEARWEQLTGNFDEKSGMVRGPTERGQRLALYRWMCTGEDKWEATELYAATNSATVQSWTAAPLAMPASHSFSNNLMPFMIGAYNDKAKNETLVIAAVLIPNSGKNDVEKKKANIGGVTAKETIADKQGWLYLVYRDTSGERLKFGTYGTLSSNCEGVFVHPQLHPGIVSWASEADTFKLPTQVWPTDGKLKTASFYNSGKITDCAEDIYDECWSVPRGRMRSFSLSAKDVYARVCAMTVTQTVDVYTAPVGTKSWEDAPVARCQVTGFGKPGVWQETVTNLWLTDDVSVQLRTGGTINDARQDVTIDNVEITQWRGQDWLGNNSIERSQGGRTNFVYTSGWISDGALQLSPRRTPEDYPCSLRVPLCDGQGPTGAKRGLGLGSLTIWYRNAQSNARLLVQISTNGVSELNLLKRTLDPGTDDTIWTTVTNWNFATLPSSGSLTCSLGLHGVAGTMRVIVDPELRGEVTGLSDPSRFGSVEITKAVFRDEPSLDKGSWWGFNIRTIGDADDDEQRMYLPDLPIRSEDPEAEWGSSLALNNSVTDGCDTNRIVSGETNPFSAHMPFLQTPTFSSNIVGEISFRARKYSLQRGSQCAEVSLYGTRSSNINNIEDKDWDLLNIFYVTNTTYETYRFKDGLSSYRAFRLAVTGVKGVTPYPGPEPISGDDPVRVLLDDVLVSEAVRARIAFRNVGAFRHNLPETTAVANVPSADEQPIVGESWGVQAEIYPAMLGEEIDSSTTPKVRLHYYKGLSPWGYEQWKSKPAAVSAWMTMATDTNTFYRSSSADSPAAVIPMADSSEIVQYMLEVVYKIVNSETGVSSYATNWLESADWSVPSWYYPVDYNASLGGGDYNEFAAFAIIDPIAPGWAWINEINVFGAFDGSTFRNTDLKKQFVEVVKPVDYDLDGWTLRMLGAKSYSSGPSALITNDVAVFGRSVPKQKAGTAKCSHMSFIVVGNPSTELTGTQYDGAWNFRTVDNNVFESGGTLGCYYPVAVQLVRPSGIIEHEVAIDGTNAFESAAAAIAWQYSSTNLVRIVRESGQPKSNIFALPDDRTSTATSTGVFGRDRGETALCWNNTMTMTPGEQNEGQDIPKDFPRPGGDLILVFASLDSSFGRITQTYGDVTNTTDALTLTLTKGSEDGLDITYSVAPWCELGTVTETEGGTPRTPEITKVTNRVYRVNVGKGATKNVTVVASAQVEGELRTKYGLDANNLYTPAVLHWLESGKDAYGNEFYDTESCEIKLAKFLPLSGGEGTDMTLTQMYWLDMDPTVGEMYFRAGMVKPPSQIVVEEPAYDPQRDPKAYTNLRVGVYMAISNGNGKVRSGKIAWPPYVLRGRGNDELSWNYSSGGTLSGAWTSETFKVTGYLNANLTSITNREAWVPLRYFVFWKNSFDSDFESEIDVIDPFSTSSPAYSEGWSRWVEEENQGVKPPVYLRWDIDERLRPITAEILAPTNRLDGTGQ